MIEGVFDRMEPQLEIFLGSNCLSSLPEELFNINSLTVLSLRGNQLREIPPAIERLPNLKDLNVSLQTRLHYLPYEILDLFCIDSRLDSFKVHPNFFYRPIYPPKVSEPQNSIGFGRVRRRRSGAIGALAPDESGRRWHPRWKALYKARTAVRFLNIDGSQLKGPEMLANMNSNESRRVPVAPPNDTPIPPAGHEHGISRVPSLMEVALKAW